MRRAKRCRDFAGLSHTIPLSLSPFLFTICANCSTIRCVTHPEQHHERATHHRDTQENFGQNDQMAQELRAEFGRNKLYVANLVSGPGAGKTELLSRTLTALGSDYRCAAVTGDLATENDAIRLAATGAPA